MSETKEVGKNEAASLLEALKGRKPERGLRVLIHGARAVSLSAFQLASALLDLGELKSVYCLSKQLGSDGLNFDPDSKLQIQEIHASAVAGLLQKGEVDVVLSGAHKIAANGDAVVDCGVVSSAIVARHFAIPFFVVTSAASLLLHVPTAKWFKNDTGNVREVVAASLIDGIVTDKGTVRRQGNEFDIASFVNHGYGVAPFAMQFSKSAALTEESVKDYIKSHPTLSERIGPATAEWTSREAGDGNINFVFIVEGPNGGLAVKQALPYIRVVGEGWPLTQDRVRIEAKWLMEQYRTCPEHVPLVYCFDQTLSLIAMEYLAPPFETLRLGILAGRIYPRMANHIGTFLSRSLFFTSAFALKSDVYRAKIVEFNNPELCRVTEQVSFMDAYYAAPTNAYLKPELDDVVADLQKNVDAKVAIGKLRSLFLSKPQALLHADFHTGSVMVTAEASYVFDAEFAFYGPIAFDVGKFIGNLLLTYFALDGHVTDATPRVEQQQWLLDSAIEVWDGFRCGFLKLWNENHGLGDAFPEALIRNPEEALDAIQANFMESLFGEVLGFAAVCMTRRIVTIAQIEDYNTIADREVRAMCSKRALKVARRLLVKGQDKDHFPDIQSVIRLAETIKSE